MSDEILSTVLGMLTKEQKQELAAKLIADVGDLQTEEEKESVIPSTSPPRKVNEDFSVTNQDKLSSRKSSVKAKSNTWTDTGEKRDPDYDPEKYKAMGRKARPETDRIKKVTKQCCVCNKSVEIAAGLVYGKFYRCDRCTG